MDQKSPSEPSETPPSTPVLGAGGVVFGPAGVLLMRYRSGAWAFPKGHVEAGETLAQAAVREVQEEGGVSAHIAAALSLTCYTNDRREQRQIHWYAMHTTSTRSVPEDTFAEGGFFAPEQAAQMLSYPEDRQLLQDALALLPDP